MFVKLFCSLIFGVPAHGHGLRAINPRWPDAFDWSLLFGHVSTEAFLVGKNILTSKALGSIWVEHGLDVPNKSLPTPKMVILSVVKTLLGAGGDRSDNVHFPGATNNKQHRHPDKSHFVSQWADIKTNILARRPDGVTA